MKQLKMEELGKFVEANIESFHNSRLQTLEKASLKDLLCRKNPYLYRAKHIVTAPELVSSLLEAKLSSSEEEIFGNFLEEVAIFVAGKTKGAKKSSAKGIDFEYSEGKIRYLVAVKSGLNWGNSGQWSDLGNSFKAATRVLRQSRHVSHVECILGASYGRAKSTTKKGFIRQVCGQAFWHLISGKKSFYMDIVKPLGYRAKELNDSFKSRKSELVNKFSGEFISEFCDRNGKILWEKIVELNSGNLRE